MENNIAPLPYSSYYNGKYKYVTTADGLHFFLVSNKATTEYIVKAANAYPKLVEFVKWCGDKEGYKLLEELGEE